MAMQVQLGTALVELKADDAKLMQSVAATRSKIASQPPVKLAYELAPRAPHQWNTTGGAGTYGLAAPHLPMLPLQELEAQARSIAKVRQAFDSQGFALEMRSVAKSLTYLHAPLAAEALGMSKFYYGAVVLEGFLPRLAAGFLGLAKSLGPLGIAGGLGLAGLAAGIGAINAKFGGMQQFPGAMAGEDATKLRNELSQAYLDRFAAKAIQSRGGTFEQFQELSKLKQQRADLSQTTNDANAMIAQQSKIAASLEARGGMIGDEELAYLASLNKQIAAQKERRKAAIEGTVLVNESIARIEADIDDAVKKADAKIAELKKRSGQAVLGALGFSTQPRATLGAMIGMGFGGPGAMFGSPVIAERMAHAEKIKAAEAEQRAHAEKRAREEAEQAAQRHFHSRRGISKAFGMTPDQAAALGGFGGPLGLLGQMQVKPAAISKSYGGEAVAPEKLAEVMAERTMKKLRERDKERDSNGKTITILESIEKNTRTKGGATVQPN